MAQQTVNIGTAANDGTGDPVRTAGTKINANFTELYAAIAASGASWKSPVRVASTADGTLATAFENGDTIDGVVLVTGDRILLRNQTAAAENGIYVVAASGAPARSADADSGVELVNAAVLVSEGTTGADKLWVCTTNAPITLGTTPLTWADITPGSIITASATEQLTGTDSAKASTPDSVAALWEQGADVASAATVSLGEGGYFAITGTTTITDIDFAIDKAGRKAWVRFAGALTLTNGANLILPTGANIVTVAGDAACFVSEGADVVRCVAYTRASGAPLVGGSGGVAWNLQWSPYDNEPPTTNFATLDTRNNHPCLDFDTTTQEGAVFSGTLPANYSGAGVTISLWVALTSATSGTVGYDVAFERMDASSLDIDADSFGAVATVAAVTVPGTSGQLLKLSVNVSNGANMDSTAAGEMFRLRIRRDVANDTAVGDAELLRVMMVSQ